MAILKYLSHVYGIMDQGYTLYLISFLLLFVFGRFIGMFKGLLNRAGAAMRLPTKE